MLIKNFSVLFWDNHSLSDFNEQLSSRESNQQRVLADSVRIGRRFAWSFVGLGSLACLVNMTILFVLLLKRKRAFKAAFYTLIFNFCLIDTLKALCLMAYAWRLLRSVRTFGGFRLDQLFTLAFRFCNLATIINLLMITLNEFIFIKYPFKYNRFVKRSVVYGLIMANWVLCLSFTVLANQRRDQTSRGIYIRTEPDSPSLIPNGDSQNSTNVDEQPQINFSVGRALASNKIVENILQINRSPNTNADTNTLFTFAFMTTFFCLACLVIVVICYVSFIRVIREIRIKDTKLYLDANYQGRLSKNAEQPGDQRQNSATLDDSQIPKTATTSGDDSRLVKQLLKRNKYAIVIGSVIIAYATFLLAYLSIQIFQSFLVKSDVTDFREQTQTGYIIRWSLQVVVGVHSILQPLCYLRMRELRRGIAQTLCSILSHCFGWCCQNQDHHQARFDISEMAVTLDHTQRLDRRSTRHSSTASGLFGHQSFQKFRLPGKFRFTHSAAASRTKHGGETSTATPNNKDTEGFTTDNCKTHHNPLNRTDLARPNVSIIVESVDSGDGGENMEVVDFVNDFSGKGKSYAPPEIVQDIDDSSDGDE